MSKRIFVNRRTHTLKFAGLFMLALLLLVCDFKYQLLVKVRTSWHDLGAPAYRLLAEPFAGLKNIKCYFQTKEALFHSNKDLQQEILLLNARLQKLMVLEQENLELHKILNTEPKLSAKFTLVKALDLNYAKFRKLILLDAKLKEGQPILDKHGLLGLVTAVHKATSEAILINDAKFAVPIENLRNGLRAIALGQGSEHLSLQYVAHTVDFKVGDQLVSSGLGGVYPFGCPVGEVIFVKHEPSADFAEILVRPAANLDNIRYVLLARD